jgi:aminoglycoside phosphotransferase (APT) family kinase protein
MGDRPARRPGALRVSDVVRDEREAAAAERPPLLVLAPLERYLDAEGIGTGAGPLAVRPIGDGHSNVTYLLERGGVRVVLRRPPRPPLPPSAHDVVREARLLSALRPAGVRVPAVLAICEGAGVIGMPFFVMEHVDGDVLGERMPERLDTVAGRADVAEELVDALAELHAVAPRDAGLGDGQRAAGYLERQVRRFGALWASRRTRDVPEVERVGRWLADHLPQAGGVAVVHGDYRLGNVMFDRERPRLRAVLDWEMATLGDPLADVGYLCATWAQPGDAENPMNLLSAVTRRPGFPSPDRLRERYGSVSGRSVEDLRFYEVLAVWKAAVFLESSYRRYREGTTDDPYFARLEQGVPQLAREALRRTQARPA